MQKTKLGITIGLAGAGLYFLGLISFFPAVLFAGYVLLYEDDEWLKKTAIKMVVVVIIFGLLGVGVDMINNIWSLFNNLIGIFGGDYIQMPLNVANICNEIIAVTKAILMVIMGMKALTLKNVDFKAADNIISKNM